MFEHLVKVWIQGGAWITGWQTTSHSPFCKEGQLAKGAVPLHTLSLPDATSWWSDRFPLTGGLMPSLLYNLAGVSGRKVRQVGTAHSGSNIYNGHLSSTKVPAGCSIPGPQLQTTGGWAWMSSSHQNSTWPGVGRDKDYPFESQTKARSYESKMTFSDTPVLCECVMHTVLPQAYCR